ncbi:MAG: aspartate kinase [Gammaproteobacteria bacterium]
MTHTVEKIGGTSMSNFPAVRDNIILREKDEKKLYNRIFVVSAYGGVTDNLLEYKNSNKQGVYALFTNSEKEYAWQQALDEVCDLMLSINKDLFHNPLLREQADGFITERIEGVRSCLMDLQLLSSLGEAHSAFNTSLLLSDEGVNARFIDLTGWREQGSYTLDNKINKALEQLRLDGELPIVTGYVQCSEGLMKTFNRGYTEMTFSRFAVLSKAAEAVIHKEYHLSSADPGIVGEDISVPIGRTNYDVADQLANLGMEAIHPMAAKGLRENDIPLRVKNTFEPEHTGTLITGDYVSETPRVEIIAGHSHITASEVFDQNMVNTNYHDRGILEVLEKCKVKIISKDLNANTITHFVDTNLKTINRIIEELEKRFPDASVNSSRVAIVSAIGSDMQVPGILAKTVGALAGNGISVLALHQSMRQVDMQFIVSEDDYESAIRRLHRELIEPLNHEYAIAASS